MSTSPPSEWSLLRGLDITVLCILLPLLPMVVTANALIIWSLLRTPQLQQSSYYFIFCLAIADFVVGAVSIPFMVYLYEKRVHSCDQPVLYAILWFVPNFMGIVSLLQVVLITVERFVAIFRPLLHEKWFLMGHMQLLSLSTWLLSALWWAIPFPALYWGVALLANPLFIIISLVIFCVGPYLFIVFMWIGILLKVRRTQHGQLSPPNELFRSVFEDDRVRELHAVDHISKNDRYIITTLSYVVLMMGLGYIPNTIWWIITLYIENTDAVDTVSAVCNILQVSNSLVNPIIYALRIKHCRNSIKSLCGCAAAGAAVGEEESGNNEAI